MLLKIVVFHLLILPNLISVIQTAKRRLDIVLNSASCQPTHPVSTQYDCDLKKLSAGNYALDMSLMFSKDLNTNSEWQTVVYFNHAQLKTGGWMKFMDFKMNICNFFTTAKSVPLIKAIVGEMRKSSNLPYQCPLKGNFLYTLSNFSINSKFLPSYTPLVKFNFSFNTYDNQKLISQLFLEGSTTLRS
uniref:MD-2-related lipid-recognition domain-containing protein n=1 Tax=Stomoxys calcitrans TaxID=35570 RepID=A0A1I8PBL1_STOCA